MNRFPYLKSEHKNTNCHKYGKGFDRRYHIRSKTLPYSIEYGFSGYWKWNSRSSIEDRWRFDRRHYLRAKIVKDSTEASLTAFLWNSLSPIFERKFLFSTEDTIPDHFGSWRFERRCPRFERRRPSSIENLLIFDRRCVIFCVFADYYIYRLLAQSFRGLN
jgi:hypothetical protein